VRNAGKIQYAISVAESFRNDVNPNAYTLRDFSRLSTIAAVYQCHPERGRA
jgi:hypothetical protein